jgi:hypothetical protein
MKTLARSSREWRSSKRIAEQGERRAGRMIQIGSANLHREYRFRSQRKEGMGRRLMPAEARMARRAFFRGMGRLPVELSLPSVAAWRRGELFPELERHGA